ncbi:penicillin-binding protein activator LpoB [Oceanimonas doudoroffii]|uniref:Penicillin-binding protein activator LpoB n=1 Tax=Oceanimonas doudoroffii TaxID=84158 RepID=A0A233RG70_9GAMM|nr:penicillin-binding protein activator LpoB [Oceanimonas doudoroffii]OXY82375.1 penicillin-binding protein activator LpoB [Oceanimonas doudoroffii]
MTPFRIATLASAALALSACTLPNPYSSQPAPVTPVTPEPQPPMLPAPAPQPPVIELPEAPPAPLPEANNASMERLADSLAARLAASAVINEVSGPVLLDDIRNQAGSPVDTRGLTERLQARLSGSLNFVSGPEVNSLRQQLAFQSGRADMASLVRLGKQSGADYLLSGSLHRAGGGFSLRAQLMELASGEVLWSDSVSGR